MIKYIVYKSKTEFTKKYAELLSMKFKLPCMSLEDAKTKILSFWQAESDTILKGVLYKKGNKIKEFYKKSLDVDLDEFAPSAEWWAQPNIEQEILGLI